MYGRQLSVNKISFKRKFHLETQDTIGKKHPRISGRGREKVYLILLFKYQHHTHKMVCCP